MDNMREPASHAGSTPPGGVPHQCSGKQPVRGTVQQEKPRRHGLFGTQHRSHPGRRSRHLQSVLVVGA